MCWAFVELIDITKVLKKFTNQNFHFKKITITLVLLIIGAKKFPRLLV